MLIRIKVFPHTRKEGIKQVKPDKFEMHIRAEAKRGEANMRAVELLWEQFPQARGIRIIKGHTTPNKTVEILEPIDSLPLFI